MFPIDFNLYFHILLYKVCNKGKYCDNEKFSICLQWKYVQIIKLKKLSV